MRQAPYSPGSLASGGSGCALKKVTGAASAIRLLQERSFSVALVSGGGLPVHAWGRRV